MEFEVNTSVGENYSDQLLFEARDKTLALINEVAAQMRPGMTEADARRKVADLEKAWGCPKPWHGPQIRFGSNTILSFGETGDSKIVLKENDIFFLDLGPIFQGHEGDVGRAFFIGDDPEMKKCCEDVETIWQKVRDQWFKKKVSGRELYIYAATVAQELGWVFQLKGASGHRVADFPHMAKRRGVIRTFEQTPSANRWILEIQIRHPHRTFGAFYEDILQ